MVAEVVVVYFRRRHQREDAEAIVQNRTQNYASIKLSIPSMLKHVSFCLVFNQSHTYFASCQSVTYTAPQGSSLISDITPAVDVASTAVPKHFSAAPHQEASSHQCIYTYLGQQPR